MAERITQVMMAKEEEERKRQKGLEDMNLKEADFEVAKQVVNVR